MYQFFEEGRESQEESGQSRQHVDVYAGLKKTFRSETNEKTKLALIQNSILSIESKTDSEEGGYRLDLYEQAVYESDLSFQFEIEAFLKCASSAIIYRVRPTMLSAYLLSLVNVKTTNFFRREVFEHWLDLIEDLDDLHLDNRLLKLLNAAVSTSLAREDRLVEVSAELSYAIEELQNHGWRSFSKYALRSDQANIVSPLKPLSDFLPLKNLEKYFERERSHHNFAGFHRVRGEQGESWICDFLSNTYATCLRTSDGDAIQLLIKMVGQAIRDGEDLFESESEFFFHLHPGSKVNHALIQYFRDMLSIMKKPGLDSERHVLALMHELFSQNEKDDWNDIGFLINRIIAYIHLFDRFSLYALANHLLYNLNVRFSLPERKLSLDIFSTLMRVIVDRVREKSWLSTFMPLFSYYYYVFQYPDWSTPRHQESHSEQFIFAYQSSVAPLFSELTEEMFSVINAAYEKELHQNDHRLLYAKYHAVIRDKVIKLREVELEKIMAYVAFHFLCQKEFHLPFRPFDFSQTLVLGEATSRVSFSFEILRGNLCNYALFLKSISLVELLLKLGVLPAPFQKDLIFNGLYCQNNNLIEHFVDSLYDALALKGTFLSVLALFRRALELGLFTQNQVFPYFTFDNYRRMEKCYTTECELQAKANGLRHAAFKMSSSETRMLLFLQGISNMISYPVDLSLKEWFVPFYDNLQTKLRAILKSVELELIESIMEFLYKVEPSLLVQGSKSLFGNILSLIVNEPQLLDQGRKRAILSLLFSQILRLDKTESIPLSIYKTCFDGPHAVFAQVSHYKKMLERFFEKGLEAGQVFENALSSFMLQFLFDHSRELSDLAFKVLSHYRDKLLALSINKAYTHEQAFLDSLSLFGKSFAVWPEFKAQLFSDEILEKLKEAFSNYKVKRALPRSKKASKQINYQAVDLGKVLLEALLKTLNPTQSRVVENAVSSSMVSEPASCSMLSESEPLCELSRDSAETEFVVPSPALLERSSPSASSQAPVASASAVSATLSRLLPASQADEKLELAASSSNRQTKEDKLYRLCIEGSYKELKKFINTSEENRELWHLLESRYQGSRHPLRILLKRKDLGFVDKVTIKVLLSLFNLSDLTENFSEALVCHWDPKSQQSFNAAYLECQKAALKKPSIKKEKPLSSVKPSEPEQAATSSLPNFGSMSDQRAIEGMLNEYGTVAELAPFFGLFYSKRRLAVFSSLCTAEPSDEVSQTQGLN